MSPVGCYAVARGRKPGIYMEWKDCAAQVLNFYGSKYKKFLNAADAELWISQNSKPVATRTAGAAASPTDSPDSPITSSTSISVLQAPTTPTRAPVANPVSQASKAVTSSVLEQAYPHTTPSGATMGNRFSRKADTTASYVVPQDISTSAIARGSGSIYSKTTIAHADRSISPPPIAPVRNVPSRTADIPSSTAVPQDTPTPIPAGGSRSTFSDPVVVYTDGSCRGNGKVGSTAGVGVWWGKDDPRNVSERCPGDQTNNRAELLAIIRVLETAPVDRPLEIRSDSEYSIKSMNVWLSDWKRRSWRRGDGKEVKNLPLVQYADLLLQWRRGAIQQTVTFKKVLAHSGEEGNEAADKLANQGALLPPVADIDWNDLMDKARERIAAAGSTSATAGKLASVPRTVSVATKQTTTPQCPATFLRPATKPPPSRKNTESSICLPGSFTPDVSVYTRTTPTELPQTSDDLSEVGRIHGELNVKISKSEEEIYAQCLLGDDDFIREAREEGVLP
ncbi:hypothetical protein C8Q80DRAFT_1176466 [Daedaleopsis nitida]|nr:hypothetical protein C8Q80DRAFT_1176466 [Daedaleopsis nitida]